MYFFVCLYLEIRKARKRNKELTIPLMLMLTILFLSSLFSMSYNSISFYLSLGLGYCLVYNNVVIQKKYANKFVISSNDFTPECSHLNICLARNFGSPSSRSSCSISCSPPWTLALVPFVGLWFILLVCELLLYRQLDTVFQIEKQFIQMEGDPWRENT